MIGVGSSFNDGVRSSISLPLRDCVIHVQQNPLSGDHAQSVWDASVCLVKYLERSSSWLNAVCSRPSRGVVELGAGCSGLCSLAAAFLPETEREDRLVIATDRETVLPLLRANMETCTAALRRHCHCHSMQCLDDNDDEMMKMKLKTRIAEVRVRALEWRNASHLQRVIDEAERDADGIGLVMAADCVFDEEMVAPFVTCIAALCARGGATAVIANERRCERTRARFEHEMREEGFSVRKVPAARQHEDFRREAVEIYIARRRARRRGKGGEE